MARIPVVVTADVPLPIDQADITGLGTAAFVDVPETGDADGTQAVLGSDSRIQVNYKIFEGVPLKTFGHSYGTAYGNLHVDGRGATSIDSVYPQRLANRMGLWLNGTARNNNVAGFLLAEVTPWAMNIPGRRWKPLGVGGDDRGIIVLDAVTNDYGYRNVNNPLEIAGYQENLRSILRWFRRSNFIASVETENWTNGAAWPNTNEGPLSMQFSPAVDVWPAAGSSSVGSIRNSPDTISSVRRTFVGDEIIISGLRSNYGTGVTAALNIYNYDADPGLTTPIDQFSLHDGYGTTVVKPTGPLPNFFMATHRSNGWGPGTHTIAIRAAVQTCFVDTSWTPCTLTGNDYPPQVFVVVDGVTYQAPPGGGTPEAAMDVWRQAIYDVIYAPDHEFDYYCTLVDMNANGWNKATMLPSEPAHLIHPNDYGQQFYTDVLANHIRFVVSDYTEGVHITV